MKYLSLFSGIGGFEIGINNAYVVRPKSERAEGTSDKHLSDTTSKDGSRGKQHPVCIGYSEIDPYADAIYKYNFGGEYVSSEESIGKCIDCGHPATAVNSEPPKTEYKCSKCGTEFTQYQSWWSNEDSEQQGKGIRDKEGQCGKLNNKRTIGQHSCRNYGDVTKINPKELPDFDLLVGGFPCQAFSIAGKRGGFEDTRGTLIFDVLRILKEKQPRHFILENVKGLLSHDSGNTFRTIITSLAELGYAVEWQVLNAKNFGVPQNRERVFIVGHLGGFGGRQIFPIRETGDGVSEQDGSVRPEILNSRKRGDKSDYNKSLLEAVVNGPVRIRRLTPTECERLMGYPDGWTKYGLYETKLKDLPKELREVKENIGIMGHYPKPDTIYTEVKEMSDTRRYKACGNGVVSNVVEEVVRRLYAT